MTTVPPASEGPQKVSLKSFVKPAARPLPVIILADVSGSMEQAGKIQALNTALAAMIDSFHGADMAKAEIHLEVIAFGQDNAWRHIALQPVTTVKWTDLEAKGRTPLGHALRTALELVEDRETIPSRAYRPTIVLLSDGQPTDDGVWQPALEELLASERASKAQRLAMGIGVDADLAVLSAFVGEGGVPVFQAHEARQIAQFFKLVTLSVTSRVKSADPNVFMSFDDLEVDLGNVDF